MSRTPSIAILAALGTLTVCSAARAELIGFEFERQIHEHQPGADEFIGAGIGDDVFVRITVDSDATDLNPDPMIGEYPLHSLEIEAGDLFISVPTGSGQFVVSDNVPYVFGAEIIQVDGFRLTCCDPGTAGTISGATFPLGADLQVAVELEQAALGRSRFDSDALPSNFRFSDWWRVRVTVHDAADRTQRLISFAIPEPSGGLLLGLVLLAVAGRARRAVP